LLIPDLHHFIKQGEAIRTDDKAIIYIDPHMEESQFLPIFCHECAHVRLHFSTLPIIEDINTQLLSPQLDRIAYRLDTFIQAIDAQAETLADYLVQFSITNQGEPMKVVYDQFTAEIVALSYWKPGMDKFQFKP
jgi:hypothetical protein